MPEPVRLSVPCSRGAYDVIVGRGVLARLGALVSARTAATRCALVTDTNVDRIWADDAAASLFSAGIEPTPFVVPEGERTKNWEQAGALLERMSEAGLGRDAIVVALGGGVVGDLAGFAAASYLRGIPVVQVPTSLLAQVDSSIGGKTGVDLPRGKNLAGAFWPPLVVAIDPTVLGTLPDDEWGSGLAEVVKSAALAGEDEYGTLERDAAALLRRDVRAVDAAVLMAVRLKCAVVGADERESGAREALNYGHTLGHALERELGYGTISHGSAVAEGMRFAARLAVSLRVGSPAWEMRQGRLLSALGLRRLPLWGTGAVGSGSPMPPGALACDAAALLSAMHADKKARGGQVRFVLSPGPGDRSVVAVEDSVLAGMLARWCESEGES